MKYLLINIYINNKIFILKNPKAYPSINLHILNTANNL